jgi:hypothetical protein
MKRILFDGDTFEHGGRTFRFKSEWDGDIGPPWKEHDGHGPVSDHKHHPFGYGSKPPKAPGERILYWDRGYYRTYDVAEATRIAKRDGWGLGEKALAELTKRLGRKPTRKQIVAEAVERDFDYLRGWCTDEWSWMSVGVEEVESGETEWLGGIQSDDYDYHAEVANELADQINHTLDKEMAADIEASRPDMAPAWMTEVAHHA